VTVAGFAKSMPLILAYEGGKVDNPRDPGGRTNQGVIQRVYDSYRRGVGKAPQDVYKMTATERDTIYRRQYWDAVQGDKLPSGVDFVVFDGGVNSGPSQSIKWLQRALGVTADGQLGMVTLDAVVNYGDYDELVDKIVDRREAFLKALKTFKTFGRGWLIRTAAVRKTGKAWANGTATPKPAKIKETIPKPLPADMAPPPSNVLGDAASGAGVGTVGLGGVLKTTQDTLTPFSSSGGWIQNLVIILIVGGALLTVGGLAYRFWVSRRRAKRADAIDGEIAP
jgi:lysozyme family protein